ncbi:MAG: hypothetical protein ACUVQY_01570 [Thermoproteota archaeon]
MSKGRAGYGGYALAVLLISLGIDGILISSGYGDPFILISLPLLLLGLYTIQFSINAADWKHYLIWGLILLCLGSSFLFTIFTGNLLLNLSIFLIIVVVIGVVISKMGKH